MAEHFAETALTDLERALVEGRWLDVAHRAGLVAERALRRRVQVVLNSEVGAHHEALKQRLVKMGPLDRLGFGQLMGALANDPALADRVLRVDLDRLRVIRNWAAHTGVDASAPSDLEVQLAVDTVWRLLAAVGLRSVADRSTVQARVGAGASPVGPRAPEVSSWNDVEASGDVLPVHELDRASQRRAFRRHASRGPRPLMVWVEGAPGMGHEAFAQSCARQLEEIPPEQPLVPLRVYWPEPASGLPAEERWGTLLEACGRLVGLGPSQALDAGALASSLGGMAAQRGRLFVRHIVDRPHATDPLLFDRYLRLSTTYHLKTPNSHLRQA